MMNFSKIAFSVLLVALSGVALSVDLPITTSDVFVQVGEVTAVSAIVNARCNSEVDSIVELVTDSGSVSMGSVTSATDYTVSYEWTGLSSSTTYVFTVTCGSLSSMQASFKTLPMPDEAAALKFVWAADLAGQGW